jgi:Protein of unknown function (DUF1634)
VLVGSVCYLWRHAGDPVNFSAFRGTEPIEAKQCRLRRRVSSPRPLNCPIGKTSTGGDPVLRVAFSLVGFALEKDKSYVVITAIALVILLYSLFSGAVG